MLKKRIIPIELFSEGRLVKTKQFKNPRDVGDPVQSSKIYSDQDADELLLLHINHEQSGLQPLIDIVHNISRNCFVPLTVGGGICSLDDVSRLFNVGADKVLINSCSYENPSLITKISEKYGSQSIVVGIDLRKKEDDYVLYSNNGRKIIKKSLKSHLDEMKFAGAGEIMIQLIDNDGLMNGYDLSLLEKVISYTSLPIIAAAGAGSFVHLKEAFETGIDALACGSLFNFGDNNPLRAKAFLKNYGVLLKKT